MPSAFNGDIRLDTDPATVNTDCDFTPTVSGDYTEYAVTFTLGTPTVAGECDLANLAETTSVRIYSACTYIKPKRPFLLSK